MRPVCLNVKGFTSFKEPVEISFEGLDRFAICGTTGAGKSSILDALTFGLFADAPRRGTGTIANLISLGRKSFSIALDFTVGDRLFRVTRVRRRSGPGCDQLEKLAGNRAELLASGERAVTEKVESLLGLNYGHFIQAVFLPQGKFAEFLKAKPADRRRLLNELLRLLVYERMQERAGKMREGHAEKLAQTERRLKEDFDGVTQEALTELERRRAEQARLVEEADRELPGLRERLETLKQGRGWTVEWESKKAEQVRHEAEMPRVCRLRREVDEAHRAAGVVPLLQQADDALRVHRQRQEALRLALVDRDQRQKEHQTANGRLAHALENAKAVPVLRERLTAMNQAKGKLGLRDQLTLQVQETQRRSANLTAQLDAARISVRKLRGDVTRLQGELERATGELESLGFREAHLQILQTQQPVAVRLQLDRAQLARLEKQARQDDTAAAQSADATERARQASEMADAALEQARRIAEGAEQTLRAAQDAHAAEHLRGGLRQGEACPVCYQDVVAVPCGEPTPELPKLTEALRIARSALSKAEGTATRASQTFAAARATSDASRSRFEASRAELARETENLARGEQALVEAVGGLLGVLSVSPLEDRALTALRQATALQKQHASAASRVQGLRVDLALKGKDLEAQQSEVLRLEGEVRTACSELTTHSQALDTVRLEIREVAGTDDPAAEATRVDAEIARLEGALTVAQRAEQEVGKHLHQAACAALVCEQEASLALRQATEREEVAAAALTEAAFPDAAVARAAHRTAQQIRLLQEEIAEYDATSRALVCRLVELESLLQGRLVTAEECRQTEHAHEARTQQRKTAETQAAVLGQLVDDVRVRLERVTHLRAELAEQMRLHHVFDWLARDLRNDRFQAYLLEETLAGLVGEASHQLGRLTGDRYGLTFADDRILVLDNDNAGERRGIDTLSGGETFLASLGLALALSGQVQSMSGAVHLDCLFIDEGFGTLDPETLRTVSDAIRGMQVGGRMVGIVTHVPELKEEFDQKLVVSKVDGTSQVQCNGV